MKKILIPVLAAFLTLNSYAENVVGDPPIDEPDNEITLADFLQMPLSQVSQLSISIKKEKGYAILGGFLIIFIQNFSV